MPSTTAAGERDASTRERLLDAADHLMYERGYEAVGIAELCREADARKGSFYYFFESKQQLALEMLDRAWHRTRSTLFGVSFGDQSLSSIDAAERFGQLLADNLERLRTATGHTTGCRFGNFALEMSTHDEDIRTAVAGVFDEMVDLVGESMRRSIARGELSADLDVELAARSIIVQMEGLMVLAKARRDPDLLRTLGTSARQLLT